MSEMVERVARAICEASGHEWRTGTYKVMSGPNWEMEDHDLDPFNNRWRHSARAAIEAMREPSDDFIRKADRMAWGGGLTAARIKQSLNVVIDAALSPMTRNPGEAE